MTTSCTPRALSPHVILLKRDALGSVELVHDRSGLAVRRVPSRAPILSTVARLLMRRERRALHALVGLLGVPRIIDREGPGGAQWRSWLPGEALALAPHLPLDFFERLEELVVAIHSVGVCHNDLHKETNILVGDDGYPALLDFQLASLHRHRGRAFAVRAAEDLRYVDKHRRSYCRRMGRTEPVGLAAPRSSLLARGWRLLWKPLYNWTTRSKTLRTRMPGEPRRPRNGPWPTWAPPVGPRPNVRA